MNAELASLQTMLTQREEVFEAMQQRLNDAVESESQKRNKEISDARGEMSEMQGLLEKMAKDLQAKAAVESELRETRNKIRERELRVDDKEHLERETESLKAELARNSDTLDQAVATVAVLANRLAETSSLAGLPPPKELVTGITKSLLDNLTGNSAKEIEASVEATAAKLVTDSASVADRIDAMLASRERDLEAARAKLEDRVAELSRSEGALQLHLDSVLTARERKAIASGGALPSCQYVYVQNNAFNAEGKAALKAAADVHGIKVHFGWPPPTPR